MVERLLKDEGWSLKAEVCPVVPPHLLLSAFPPVPCPFQLPGFSFPPFRPVLFAFCFSVVRCPPSGLRISNSSPWKRENPWSKVTSRRPAHLANAARYASVQRFGEVRPRLQKSPSRSSNPGGSARLLTSGSARNSWSFFHAAKGRSTWSPMMAW